MDDSRIEPNGRSKWNSDFWMDLSAFAKMIAQMPFQR
jgi:hypothetical protein